MRRTKFPKLKGFSLLELAVGMVIVAILVGIAAVRWKDPSILRTQAVAQVLKEYLLKAPDRAKASNYGVLLILRNPAYFTGEPTFAFQEYRNKAKTETEWAFYSEAVNLADQGVAISSDFAIAEGNPFSAGQGVTYIEVKTNGTLSTSVMTRGVFDLAPLKPGEVWDASVQPLHRVVFDPGSGSPSVKVCEWVGTESPTCTFPTYTGWCDAHNTSLVC